MKVSLNWIKQYIDFEVPPITELAEHIGSQLGAVEEIIDLGTKYQGAVIARVMSCVDHPNSDHLHICLVDDGGVVKDVERDDKGYVQVVCGAPNVREGLTVVWLPPGTTVPESADKDPFILSVREIRGTKSNGMLASARELAIGNNHEGILEVDKDAKPGEPFAPVYDLDDYIIDIENKMFTHRPDCFGEIGVAREIAGILHHPFHSPAWYLEGISNTLSHGTELPLQVQNELPDQVPRFMAVALSDVDIKPSPIWLQTYLSRVGIRPISNVVDITNYMMMQTGQPLHAYDYDKVRKLSNGQSATLAVRYPRPGEKLLLLNGKEIEPRAEAIMIATDKQAIGLGGIMGGADTEVDDSTRNIILECATFDMYSIRKTSMAHGLFTDAVSRFNKGQSPLQNDKVLGESLRLLGELSGAALAGDVIDNNHIGARAWVHPPVPVNTAFINVRLGLQLAAQDMKQLLEAVEFSVTVDEDNLTVTAPFWRTDIEVREDVVEEVGRLYGYDRLPLELPHRDISPAPHDPLLELKAQARAVLSAAGANETLTYSFVHGSLLDKAGQDREQAFRLSNALSPDLQYYRLSMTPSLLDKIHGNIKAGFGTFALFEMGRVHNKNEWDEDGLPREVNALAFVIAAENKVAKDRYAGAAYYEARAYLERLLTKENVRDLITLEPLVGATLTDNPWTIQLVAPYDPNRSALLRGSDGLIWGVVGEFKTSVRTALKLPEFTAGFELDPLLLLLNIATERYEPLPRFPKVEQDICLRVDAAMLYQQIYDFVAKQVEMLRPEHSRTKLTPVDIYQRSDDLAHRQITLRLAIASYEKTLTDVEVARLLDDVAKEASTQLNVERV